MSKITPGLTASLIGRLADAHDSRNPQSQQARRPSPYPPQGFRPSGTCTCRLTLSLNGTAYNVRPLPVDQDAATKAFWLRKADGTTYDVARTVHGSECSCPDWIFNRDGKDVSGCKHIKAMKACGLL